MEARIYSTLRPLYFMVGDVAEITGAGKDRIRKQLENGTLPKMGQFKEGKFWWFDKDEVHAFMKTEQYTRWRGVSWEELTAEYNHLARIMGDVWARERLQKVYGMSAGAIEKALEKRREQRWRPLSA